jgi:hypothetical protein
MKCRKAMVRGERQWLIVEYGQRNEMNKEKGKETMGT